MSETSRSIGAWGAAAFGPVLDPAALIDRALVEMSELRDAAAQGDMTEIGAEAADVAILLHRLLDEYGLDLTARWTPK